MLHLDISYFYIRSSLSLKKIENANLKINKLKSGPIGVFDSGYGGLTILNELTKVLPEYNYIYLGDNARSPYGNRSFETVTEYTQQSVKALFSMGCNLVILACNTASAKALRSIQQNYLPQNDHEKRVLGVIRPTTEIIGKYSKTGQVGILGTLGTVSSLSYPIEIKKFFPDIKVFQQACPLWVPLIENNEHQSRGADYFVEKYLNLLLNQSPEIDVIVLACTHYPLMMNKIRDYLPTHIKVIAQGEIVAQSLKNYLSRHLEMDELCDRGSKRTFITSDDTTAFDAMAGIFFGQPVNSAHIDLNSFTF